MRNPGSGGREHGGPAGRGGKGPGAPKAQRRNGKFTRAATLMQSRIREASSQRGFAVSRLLTHWHEIAGPDIAAISRPAQVTYGRGGLGATLTLLTTGANAPLIEMQKEALRERVNSCYGYRAIARIQITQTAPTGFAEGRASFAPAPSATRAPERPDPVLAARAHEAVAPIGDEGLRAALEELGRRILTKDSTTRTQE